MQLQADLGTAAAAYLLQCSLDGSHMLPAAALLELAVGCGQLLCEDASTAQPALLGTTFAAQPVVAAGQPLLLSCCIDTCGGTAKVQHPDSAPEHSAALLSCSYGLAVAAQPAEMQCAAASKAACRAAALCGSLLLPAALSAASASLPAPSHALGGSLLPAALSEAATVAAAAAGLAGWRASVRSCAAILPGSLAGRCTNAGSPQHFVLAGGSANSTSRLQLATSCSSDGPCTARLCGLELAAKQAHEPASSAYAVAWQRVPAGEADPR